MERVGGLFGKGQKRIDLQGRAGRTAIAPVLKTGARKGLEVRILCSPQYLTSANSAYGKRQKRAI
jgi:hypothetical protein